MMEIDVLVIGGGLQGLLVLDGLARSGRSCVLVSPTDVGIGQTLHSHGVLNTGFGMFGPEPVQLLQRVVLPDLLRRGIATYGERYAVLPPGMPGDAQVSPPPGLEPHGGQLRRLPEVNFAKVQLVETLMAGLANRIVRGSVASVTRAPSGKVTAVEVASASASDALVFAPNTIVVAAGTGTKPLLRRLGAAEAQLEPIKHRRVHVLCVRGPSSALPLLDILWMAAQLFVAAHDDGGETTWTQQRWTSARRTSRRCPATPSPMSMKAWSPKAGSSCSSSTHRSARRPDCVSPPTPVTGKTSGDRPRVPMCARIAPAPNVVAALPSGLLGAWPIARSAVEMATEGLAESRPQPAIAIDALGARVGLPSEDGGAVVWTSRPATR